VKYVGPADCRWTSRSRRCRPDEQLKA